MIGRPVAAVAGLGAAGAATARRLAEAGFHVVALDHNAVTADGVARALVGDGLSAEGLGLDLLDVDAVDRWHRELIERLGRLDVLIHLVGGWRGSPGFDISALANWQALHPRVVGTLATLTSVCADSIRTSPKGRVVMVSSTAVDRPTAGNTAYVAAKAAAEAWLAGVAASFAGTPAAAVVIRVRALMTDEMVAGRPDADWSGSTHVDDLARAITSACTGAVGNGERIDLTR